jgi:hypothetical protein
LWESADRLWRYRYVHPEPRRPIISNRGYVSREEAIRSAELAYPGVPIVQLLAPPQAAARRRPIRTLVRATTISGVVGIIVVGTAKLALRMRRVARRIRRVSGLVRVAANLLPGRRGGSE